MKIKPDPQCVQALLEYDPEIGSGDVSLCLPGWIESLSKEFDKGKGVKYSHNAVAALLHTLVASRQRVARLVMERDALKP